MQKNAIRGLPCFLGSHITTYDNAFLGHNLATLVLRTPGTLQSLRYTQGDPTVVPLLTRKLQHPGHELLPRRHGSISDRVGIGAVNERFAAQTCQGIPNRSCYREPVLEIRQSARVCRAYSIPLACFSAAALSSSFAMIATSTRRFWDLPSAVALVAIG